MGVKMKKILIAISIVVVLTIIGYVVYKSFSNLTKKNSNIISGQNQKWQGENIAIEGKYADADVIAIEDGKYRLYYSEEPDAAGFSGKIYSSISSDGINWTKEDGIRKDMATFPDIIKLPNGQYRMYFQNSGVIKSAISSDGLNWQDEPDTRVDGNIDGFTLDNVAASTTTILDDNSYLMVYRGTINEPYGTEKLPNQFTQLAFYATSPDGLNFTKHGVAVDSRNSVLKGLIDGPDFVSWDNNELRLYFWTYSGVYYVVYQNGQFDQEPKLDYSNSTDSKSSFLQNPPGDPTIVKISDAWFMYYGQHTKGIYYTKYK